MIRQSILRSSAFSSDADIGFASPPLRRNSNAASWVLALRMSLTSPTAWYGLESRAEVSMSFSSPLDLDMVMSSGRYVFKGAKKGHTSQLKHKKTRGHKPVDILARYVCWATGEDGSSRLCLTTPTNFFFLGHNKTSTPTIQILANRTSSAISQFILCQASSTARLRLADHCSAEQRYQEA